MLFNSAAFALFLPVMLAAYWLLRGRARRVALLAGSYFFYAWWDWRFLGLLVFSTLLDYSLARAIDRRTCVVARRRLLTVSLVANLGVLAAFKYFDFFRDSFAAGCELLGLRVDLPTL